MFSGMNFTVSFMQDVTLSVIFNSVLFLVETKRFGEKAAYD